MKSIKTSPFQRVVVGSLSGFMLQSIRHFGFAVPSLLASYLWFHLCLWNTPSNPVRDSWEDSLQIVVGRILTQNWRLFAPNPISSDHIMLIKPVRIEDVGKFIFEKEQYQEGWIDITDPIWNAFHSSRFSAYDRISRAVTGPLRTYLYGPSDLKHYLVGQGKSESEVKSHIKARLIEARQASEKSIQKVGSIAMLNIFGDNPDVSHFAVLIRTSIPVEWKDRSDKKKNYKDNFAGIYRVDRFATNSVLFQGNKL